MFYKIGVLRNFEKTPKKTPVQKSIFNAVANLKTAIALKNYSSAGVFSRINLKFKSAEHLWIGTFQGKTYVGSLFQ